MPGWESAGGHKEGEGDGGGKDGICSAMAAAMGQKGHKC